MMKELNVMSPNLVTRVSEYIPEIVSYIETIVQNGYAYQSSDGSVYFDVKKFELDGYQYCKLNPGAYKSDGNSQEDETTKRSKADFALWKSNKPGDPFWESPWGKGRPGWHIECSAMIQAALDKDQKLDIHSGGFDLKFPHHDNEIAQGEAHDCKQDWVKYFIHVAPLNIKGLKMSKSLKNFITIEEAL